MQLFQRIQFFLLFHPFTADADVADTRQLKHIAQQPVVVGTVVDIADK